MAENVFKLTERAMRPLTRLFAGRPTRVAVLQMRLHHNQRSRNLDTVLQGMTQAAAAGVDLLCLPAACCTGLNFPSLKRDAEPLDGPLLTQLREAAQRLGLMLVLGLLERGEGELAGQIFDSAVCIGADGALLGVYRRRCLWSGERAYLSAGSATPQLIQTPWGRLGLLVSYDLRFPEAWRPYYLQEADVIVCVANLFTRYSHAVPTLVRARAAECSCYVVLASCVGENGFAMLDYLGGSMVVDGCVMEASSDALRDVLAAAPPGPTEQMLQAELYMRQRAQRAAQLPYLEDYLQQWADTAPGAEVA
ncbi:carbon-nitrogen hydrolase family protein [Roseateles sp. BYS180W]|uniref:Carbon-nitrogen hydrolase family protein n=1 Tax=Roseateles rivi TaxID=3299028 RepID=A0ABW7FU42_9BURK